MDMENFCGGMYFYAEPKTLDIENFCWTCNFGHGKFFLDM